MTAQRTTTRFLVGALGALSLIVAACGDDDSTEDTTAATSVDTTAPDSTTAETTAPETTTPNLYTGVLEGFFEINPGQCDGTAVTGSYFRMVQAGGTADAGPFIPNSDSLCTGDPSYTLLTFGTDGALMTTALQTAPDPAFDATGNGLADRIVMPVKFFGVDFAVAMDAGGPMATVTEENGVLTAELSAFTAYYGTGVFNQGAPKPDGSGTAATGTLNPVDGHYTLEWTSLIVGGSFDGYMGVWHFEGRFTPSS